MSRQCSPRDYGGRADSRFPQAMRRQSRRRGSHVQGPGNDRRRI